jgi:hypothetical protein
MTKRELLKLEEMEEIAKKATHDALLSYPRLEGPDSDNLTLGTRLTDEEGIFELYIAGQRPVDARVISCARVDRRSGAVSVHVFIEK